MLSPDDGIYALTALRELTFHVKHLMSIVLKLLEKSLTFLRKPFWRYVFWPLVINAAFLVALMARDPSWWGLRPMMERLACAFGPREAAFQGLHQGFADQTPPPQTLVSATPAGTRRGDAADAGWEALTVPEGGQTQVMIFDVRAETDKLTFFPRVSGAESFVAVAVVRAGKTVELARLTGKPEVWTPIGARWVLPLACLDRDAPIRFQVTLSGPWAQLWTRQGKAFF
jgi:hypothetical protein